MKIRQSGMPEEEYWSSFFDAEALVQKMLGNKGCQGDLLEFGAGYGTFTLPAAGLTSGVVTAYEIEPNLISQLENLAKQYSLDNIKVQAHDFVKNGVALEDKSQSHVMLYNLLHLDEPQKVLAEAHRVLKVGSSLSIIHWRSDIETPRGPSLDIRPTPEQSTRLLKRAGFKEVKSIDLEDCAPYHYGLIAKR